MIVGEKSSTESRLSLGSLVADPVRAPLGSILQGRYTHYCVGSLPFGDPAQAVDFLLSRPWIVPFWPELPKMSARESMLGRSARALASTWQGYAEDEAHGLPALLKRLAAPIPLLKTQCCGPLTLTLFSAALSGSFETRLERAFEGAARELSWQCGQLSPYAERLLLVLDEPGFIAWPSLDLISKRAYTRMLSGLYLRAAASGNYFGIHSCADCPGELLDLPAHLLSFKLDAAILTAIQASGDFARWDRALERGVVLVPGAFAAVTPSNFDAELTQGRARLAAFADLLCRSNLRFLRSAECGHPHADHGWLQRLYLQALG